MDLIIGLFSRISQAENTLKGTEREREREREREKEKKRELV